MRTHRIPILALAVLALAAGPALAQRTVDLKHPAAPDGTIDIECYAGSVRVIGWSQEQVTVSGRSGSDSGDVSLTGEGRHLRVEVEPRHHSHGAHADIEVRVPSRSDVTVQAFSASTEVRDVTGRVSVNSMEGAIVVSGAAKEVDVQNVSGPIEISGVKGRLNVESVNGRVTLRGSGGDVEASTVNGPLEVEGGAFERGSLETVSGNLRFDGDVVGNASMSFESVSGNIELTLPARLDASYTAQSFSGSVVNELGPPARRTSKYVPGTELSFSVGSGAARIEINTMSGDIALRKKK